MSSGVYPAEHRVRVGRAPTVARKVETVRLETAIAVLDEALTRVDCSYDDRGRPVMCHQKAREKFRARLIDRLQKDARR